MSMHEYTWKNGFEFSSRTTFRANKPVTESTVLVDLYDGRRFMVSALYAAKPTDREFTFLPDTVMHTWPAGSLSDDELSKLREKAKYTADEDSAPLAYVVFLAAAA